MIWLYHVYVDKAKKSALKAVYRVKHNLKWQKK